MIHFSCMYCGKKIRAKDKLVGRRAPCPACGHRLLIPKPRVETPPESDVSPLGARFRKDRFFGRDQGAHPTCEVGNGLAQAQTVLNHPITLLAPRYDELTLFAMSVTFLLLLWIDPDAHRDLSKVALFVRDDEILMLGLLAALGMVFSLFGIFFKRPKPDVVKWPMLFFAVAVTAGTGIYAGYVTLQLARGWLVVFPIWNILNGILLILILRAGLLAPDCIIDGAAKLWQLVITLLTVGLLLGLCHYVFKLHWAISYSICLGYTMSLHRAVTDVFGGVVREAR